MTKSNAKNIRVAIVHDYLRTFGGAERVLLLLHEIFPNAKIYMANVDFKRMGRFGNLFSELDISTSWVQKFFVFVKKPILYRPILPLVWRSIDIGKVDVVISSSGANIAKGVHIPKGAIHFCYCHTPPRYLYGLETETNFARLPVVGFFVKVIISYLRIYDQMTNKRVDYFIANSKTVQKRIKKYYKRDSVIIYPSSRLINVEKSNILTKATQNKGGYYLVVSRLVSYKHIDIIVKAFNSLGYRLRIIGDGPDRARLEKMAFPNIKFLGSVSDEELKEYYKSCNAIIVTTPEEDFGLTPVEAQSYGKPVIAYYSGGLKETVIGGKTGIFFRQFSERSITKAVQKSEKIKFNTFECFKNSQKFSEQNFKRNITKFIESHLPEGKSHDEQSLTRIFLFGTVPVTNISVEDFITLTVDWILKKEKKLICYLNTFGVTNYLKNRNFASAINSASIIYSDGCGPVFASKILGGKLSERVNAADFIDEFFEKINNKKVKLYLLGDTQKVLKIAAKNIESKYPNIKVVGYNNGFFSNDENEKIIEVINSKKPNLVLVGMGSPRQETWVFNNYSRLPNAVYWCVGGLFNYIAGTRKRAPLWMRQLGLEWLYRLFQEPKRLWRRYTIVNLEFVWRVFVSWLNKYFF